VGIKNSLLTVYLFKENISKQQSQFEVVKLPLLMAFFLSGPCDARMTNTLKSDNGCFKEEEAYIAHIRIWCYHGFQLTSDLASGTSEMA